MRLTNIGLIDWHTYGATDIPVIGDTIGVVGANGSGKSTLLDAVHVLFTGGVDIKLNKRASGEKSGSDGERRTIHSYCLGRLDGGYTIRDEANTYLLAGFRDPAGKKKPVTIILAFHALKGESKHHLEGRVLIKGAYLTARDLIATDKEGAISETWNETRTRIQNKVAMMGGEMQLFATAKDYVQGFMQALMYRGEYETYKQFLKNLDNALSFNSVGSATEFMQRYVLPERPINIHDLRSNASTYNRLVEHIRKIKGQIAELDTLTEKLEALRTNAMTEDREKAIAAMAAALNSRQAKRRLIRDTENLQAKLDALKNEWTNLDGNLSYMKGKENELRDRRSRMGSADAIELMRSKIREDRTFIDERIALLLGGEGIGRNAHMVRYKLSGIAGIDTVQRAFVDLNEAVNGSGNASIEYLPEDAAEADRAYASAVAVLPSAKSAVDAELDAVRFKHQTLRSQFDAVKQDVAAAEENRVVHDRETTSFIDTLRSHGIDADILCDVLEITDEAWREAVERLLGRNRDAVLVSPGDYDRACAIFEAEQRRFQNLNLVITPKLVRHQKRGRAGGIGDVVTSDNPLAAAYVDFKWGTVQLASSRDDFKKDGRWLLSSGLYSDGISVSSLRETTPKIGRNAASRSLPILKDKAAGLAREISPLSAREYELKNLLSALERLSTIHNSLGTDAPFSASAIAIHERRAEIASRQRDMDDLEDASDTTGIDIEIEELKTQINEIDARRTELSGIQAVTKRELDEARDKLKAVENVVGSELNVAKTGGVYRSTLLGLKFPDQRRKYYSEFKARTKADKGELPRIQHSANQACSAAAEFRLAQTGITTQEAKRCIDLLEAHGELPQSPSLMDDIRPWAVSTLDDLRNDKLLEYETLLEKCRSDSDELFKTSFVNELASRFAEVRKQIDNLNSVIRDTEFLNEVYKIKRLPAPGRDCFHTVVKHQDALNTAVAGGGLLLTTLPDDVSVAMEEIKSIIFAPDSVVDLEEYTDYRKYFTFELEMRNPYTGVVNTLKSRKGTASGGELQTPYYICMMAAMSNVYYGGPYKDLKKDDGGLCVAIFDEAFSNMDENVTGQVIELGRALGLQMLICGPSNKKVILQRDCDSMLTVAREKNGTVTTIYPEIIKQLSRDKLRELDPSLLSDVEIAERMLEANGG